MHGCDGTGYVSTLVHVFNLANEVVTYHKYTT